MAQVDRAVKGGMEAAVCARVWAWEGVHMVRCRTCALPKHRHAGRVAAKRARVGLDPAEGVALVLEAHVPGGALLLEQLVVGEKPKDAQPVINGDYLCRAPRRCCCGGLFWWTVASRGGGDQICCQMLAGSRQEGKKDGCTGRRGMGGRTTAGSPVAHRTLPS